MTNIHIKSLNKNQFSITQQNIHAQFSLKYISFTGIHNKSLWIQSGGVNNTFPNPNHPKQPTPNHNKSLLFVQRWPCAIDGTLKPRTDQQAHLWMWTKARHVNASNNQQPFSTHTHTTKASHANLEMWLKNRSMLMSQIANSKSSHIHTDMLHQQTHTFVSSPLAQQQSSGERHTNVSCCTWKCEMGFCMCAYCVTLDQQISLRLKLHLTNHSHHTSHNCSEMLLNGTNQH